MEELIEKAKNGDKEAFTKLILEEEAKLYKIAKARLKKEGNIIAQARMTTPKEFPRSKKLYIRIFNIGYTMYEYNEENPEMSLSEKFKLTEAEWKLEIEVPESFYQRKSVKLKLAQEVEGLN